MSAPEQKDTKPRKGMPDVQLSEKEFRLRFLEQFVDPAFKSVKQEIERVTDIAWQAYSHHRKAPRRRRAGPEFADPDYELSLDWLAARQAIADAQKRHDDPNDVLRILVINASSRSEHTCPGEISKSFRLAEIAKNVFAAQPNIAVKELDLSRITSEYGRNIYPCKACFSTSPALCHWPCSCYPNHALGQTQDWMNDIYPLWVEAHGILLITPVHWYQATSPLKLMMDRMVCADGGNPDSTRTKGKNVELAKTIELEGWDYPKHLKGRVFGIVVHGDAEGVGSVRHALTDWLLSMELVAAGGPALLDRYVGYWTPYATSHAALDEDKALQEEVRNAARTVLETAMASRSGKLTEGGQNLRAPRKK